MLQKAKKKSATELLKKYCHLRNRAAYWILNSYPLYLWKKPIENLEENFSYFAFLYFRFQVKSPSGLDRKRSCVVGGFDGKSTFPSCCLQTDPKRFLVNSSKLIIEPDMNLKWIWNEPKEAWKQTRNFRKKPKPNPKWTQT